MPILPENFVANTLSGTILVTDGFANINLATNPYALEGDKSFVVKIRKGGIDGLVIASTPTITLKDNSQFVSLTANVSTVAEGNLVSFTLVTANASDNANVFYSIFPVTANVNAQDFVGANVGKATIFNNQAVFSYFANADYSIVDETGETFKVQLRTNSPTGNIIYTTSNVAITDFYKTINVFRFEESASTVAEGSTVTFTVFAHNISPGTLLYYYTSGTADIAGSNTGSVVMNDISNTITITTAATVPSEQTRNFRLNLATSDLGTIIATSNNISVADLSLTTITATGGNVVTTDGYRIHTFTTSGNLTITGTSPVTQLEYLAVAGGGGGAGANSPNFLRGGGGGGGGLIFGNLSAENSGNILVIVGAAGAASSRGGNTQISNLTAFGGGSGAGHPFTPTSLAKSGGSGGGGAPSSSPAGTGTPGQGNPGGAFSPGGGGGGGGYNSPGGNAPPTVGGNGGFGYRSLISGANVGYSGGGGGGGGTVSPRVVSAAFDGGGAGYAPNQGSGSPGTVNTGGGGGGMAGTSGTQAGAAGGSGVVIIRYPYTDPLLFNSVTANTSAVVAGTNAFFVVNTTFANASTLYYDTIGNVTSASFVSGNTGSFTVTGNATVLRLETTETVPQDEERMFALRIREDSATTGNIRLVSSNVYIYDSDATGLYSLASGGNITVTDGYKIHTFTTSNTFSISSLGKVGKTLEYLVVAGGGGGGGAQPVEMAGAGGGAGGYLSGTVTLSTTGDLSVVVGAGGNGGIGNAGFATGGNGFKGSNSSIISSLSANVISLGGGGGRGYFNGDTTPLSGGSGGGGSNHPSSFPAGSGTPGQGNPGGAGAPGSPNGTSGGGGGAGGAGEIGVSSPYSGGYGGSGRYSTISGFNVAYAGGGGAGKGGVGRDGGGNGSPTGNGPGTAANVNTGGGGGGSSTGPASGDIVGASGGSGIVIIRYPYVEPKGFTSVTANTSVVVEGSNAFFVVNTTFANASTLYYDTIGDVTSTSFVGGNTGSFVVTGNATVLRLETVANIPTDETRNFQLRIRKDSITGNIILISSNVNIFDSEYPYYIASGGIETTVSNFKIHTFTTSGTFDIVSNGGATSNVEMLIVAAGGGGGTSGGGGAGGGGVLFGNVSLATGNYTIAIGAGGTAGFTTPPGTERTGLPGGNTTVNILLAIGGGGGLGNGQPNAQRSSGGSSGGSTSYAGGVPAARTMQTSQGGLIGYGNAGYGDPSAGIYAAGGGGAGGAGQRGPSAFNGGTTPGAGGAGIFATISGSGQFYANGGAGAANTVNIPNSAVNTGRGGTGADNADLFTARNGGSGIVIIRYPIA